MDINAIGTLVQDVAPPPSPANLASLLKTAFDGGDLASRRRPLLARLQSDPGDAAALMDLCVIDQVLGNQSAGLLRQQEALTHHRLYRSTWPASAGALRVLAFLTPGDLGANTPLEFLLQGWDVVMYSLYVVPGKPLPCPLPEHDIAIVIAGESDQARPVLCEIERLIAGWPCPVLNPPAHILRLAREEMHRLLAPIPGVFLPATIRVDRASLVCLGQGLLPIRRLVSGAEFPLIVRTIGSHAGRGLAKLDDFAAVGDYLAAHPEPEFFLSWFVDYRSADGLFRKYRIIWVDGRPYPCHMAIANEWKVWFLNAGMATSASKRAEEAHFMATFDQGFARRHSLALAAIAERFGLAYAGIDCAELPDGRLLVFEGDVALVVHDMDPPDVYPYKAPHMRKIFRAFYEMLRRHCAISSPRGDQCRKS